LIGKQNLETEESEFSEKVVAINRVAKVHKGGKSISFTALVVVGNKKGKVGIGLGKAHEVAEAIKKGIKQAKRDIITVALKQNTIPHGVIGHFGGGKILLKPASSGTGVIAAGAVRAICEMVGIKDVLTKSLGSNTVVNLAKATIDALTQLRLTRVEEGVKS
jgi:small subunit ribosomal protein S5